MNAGGIREVGMLFRSSSPAGSYILAEN